MRFSRKDFLISTVAALSIMVATPGFACSSCGCSLGSEWANENYSTSAGLSLDLRYDFVNQNELRTGSHTASGADVAAQLASGSVGEVQQGTLTRYATLSADYAFNRDWGVNLQLPYLQRTHGTIADGDTDASLSDKDGLGDVRLVGRYQGVFDDRSLGLQLGMKFPTGSFHQDFSGGPGAGTPLDRGLQLGTGTTDLIAGAYYNIAFHRDWDHFEQLQIKVPLNAREDFRPGNQVSANAGVRYVGARNFLPQVQVNLKWEGKESGAQADRPNSGSVEIYVSPGLSFHPMARLSVYGFVQLPVYRDYKGLQLAPHYSVTSGLHYAF